MADPTPARAGRKKPRTRVPKALSTTAPQPALRDRAATLAADIPVSVEDRGVVVRIDNAPELLVTPLSGAALVKELRPRVRRVLAAGLGRQPDAEALRVALDEIVLRIAEAQIQHAELRKATAEARHVERAAAEELVQARVEAGDLLGAVASHPDVAAALSDLRRATGQDEEADFAACVHAYAAEHEIADEQGAAIALLEESLDTSLITKDTILQIRQLLGRPVFVAGDATDDIVVDVIRYEDTESGMVRIVPSKAGEERLLIANFSSKIKTEIVKDDGVEQRLEFDVQVRQGDRNATVRVKAGDLAKADWAIEALGSTACITAGASIRDHVRAAMQMLSGTPERVHIYTHTGWVQRGAMWQYLHAAGAIASSGLVTSASVELAPDLAHIHFQAVAEGEALRTGIGLVHELARVAEPRLISLLLGTLFRSVLPGAPPDLSVWLEGGTGRLKTSLAVVILQFQGRRFSASGLPNWSSTANALEATLFAGKDALVVIDDAAPDGTERERSALAGKVARILRAQANHAGRARANRDGTLRAALPPRGMLLVTAEDLPVGASILARTLTYTVPPAGEPGGVSRAELLRAQQFADAGVYEAVFARFIMYLAQEYDALAAEFRELFDDALALWSPDIGHLRTPANVAHIMTGWTVWLRFVVSVNAMTRAEADEYLETVQAELLTVGYAHDRPRGESDPITLFRRYLASALGSGIAHLAARDGTRPEEPGLGWQLRERMTSDGQHLAEPQGERVGWIDGDDLFLDLDAAHRASQTAAGRREHGIPISAQALGSRLAEAKFLVTRDADKRNTTRRTIEGAERRVYHLRRAFLDLDSEPQLTARMPGTTSPSFTSCGRKPHPDRTCVAEVE